MSWIECVVDTDYEIFTEFPYDLRKKGSTEKVKEYVETNGYLRLSLNGRKYYKHVIVAKQFIPNPDNLPEVDHLNNDRGDYHIENLRFVSHSDNLKNRLSSRGVIYEFIEDDEVPDDTIIVSDYGSHEFEDYYYSETLDRFMYDNGIKTRLLHINYDKRNGSAFVILNDINNVRVNVYYTKFKKIYGFN